MGCKYACVCSGQCLGCSRYEPESYVGEAENIYDDYAEEDREEK